MKIAVIGAGAAGLTAAYRLARGGAEVEVFEAGPTVGGLARSLTLWGQTVDLGPHRFFSSDRRVNEHWLEVVGRDYAMVDRLTRIYYQGRFFHYPLKPLDALMQLGPVEAARCMLSYARERAAPTVAEGEARSFEDWVVGRFGRRLFEIFFKTYSEKLWGVPCQELDADFAAQRIKKLSLYEAVKNAFLGGRGNTHKTLVERFAYPAQGTGMVYRRMTEAVEASGGKVRLKAPVKRVVLEGGAARGLELASGEKRGFDHVVSTMPLTLMVQSLDGVPAPVLEAARALTFRNTILVYLHVDGVDLFPDNWLYVHSGDLRMGRVTNFRNWVPGLYGAAKTTILALEYWCYDDDAIWTEPDGALIDRAKAEMRATGLLGGHPFVEREGQSAGHVERIRRCYPVYRMGYRDQVTAVAGHLRGVQGLTPIGRYGAFKYNNQDHSILMGLLAAENILQGAGHDLWTINTDYEAYQEGTVITETGLLPLGDKPE